MNKKRTAIQIWTWTHLAERAASEPALLSYLDRYTEIEARGGKPVIRYSKSNGVSVVDESLPVVISGDLGVSLGCDNY